MSILKDELINDPTGLGYVGLDNSATASALNAKAISAKQSIQVSDIKKYLTVVGKRVAINNSASIPAQATVLAFQDFEVFDMTDALNEAALISQMGGLVTEGLISETDKTNILAMGDTLISRAQSLGLGIVTAGQVQAERN